MSLKWTHDVSSSVGRGNFTWTWYIVGGRIIIVFWNTKRIVLLPLSTTKEATMPHKSITLSRAHFYNEVKFAPVVVTLITSRLLVLLEYKLPIEVEELLKLFSEIYFTKEPSKLPTLCLIQHQINFIPRATLPNLPHYWMGLKESEALLSIVNELLTKQLIALVLFQPC